MERYLPRLLKPLKCLWTISLFMLLSFAVKAQQPFVTTWKTNASNESITIPVNDDVTGYNYTVDWGDGEVSDAQTGDASHTYASAGTYVVTISGNFRAIRLQRVGNEVSDKLASIEQWGDIPWSSMEGAFSGARNMVLNATDVPDLSGVSSLARMFDGAEAVNGDLSGWDVSGITDMSSMFYNAFAFNGNISNWNVSNVTNMQGMFWQASVFNQDIGGWDVGNVADMSYMFYQAPVFNQDLSGWDVSHVTTMNSMFFIALDFDQSLGSWDISNVTDMDDMLLATGLSSANYGATLIGWAALPTVPSNITLDAAGQEYCPGTAAATARQQLIGKGWTITGDTEATDCGGGGIGPADPSNFVTVWKTDNTAGTGPDQIRIPATGEFSYTWVDINNPAATGAGSGNDETIITFPQPGSYEVRIVPTGSTPFHAIQLFYNFAGNDASKLLEVKNWGTIHWSRFVFYGCDNLKITAADIPDLTGVTDLSFTFSKSGIESISNINDWDVSTVTNLSNLFEDVTGFNQSLDNWDVSNVTNMGFMFDGATSFNQPLDSWDVSKLENFDYMFRDAASFNQSLGAWNLANFVGSVGVFFQSGVSCENYSYTLYGWATNPNTKAGAIFHPWAPMEYSPDVTTYRDFLINDLGWDITGDALGTCSITLPSTPVTPDNNTLYVDINVNTSAADYTGAGNSWENAIPQLADALKWAREQHDGGSPGWTGANPLRIFVAKGEYKPLYNAADGAYTADGGRDNSFVLVPNVQLYGGFDPAAGVETLDDARILPDRNGLGEGSILSGDFLGNDNADDFANHTENAYQVVIGSGEVGTARIDGFELTGGNANGVDAVSVNGRNFQRQNGGGIFNHFSSPTLIRMSIRNNAAESGGGMYSNESSPMLTHVSIRYNKAYTWGGGIFSFESSPKLINVGIYDNTANDRGSGILHVSGIMEITNSTIAGNGPNTFNHSGVLELNNTIAWGDVGELRAATTNSLIEGNTNTDNGNIDATGLTAADIFVDPDNGDYSLKASSAAINAGSNTAYTDAGGNLANDVDLAGDPRVYNQTAGGVIDVGAYEFQGELNTRPTAVVDSITVTENIPATGNVLTNDSDPDGNAMTASLVTAPVNGTVVLNADGSFTYTPNADYHGLDSLLYQVCDNGTPSLCDSAWVFYTVKATGKVPDADNILYVNLEVDQTAAGYTGLGDSWENAIPELADALKWAREEHDGGGPGWTETEPLRIFVAKGTYLPLYHAADAQYTMDGGRDNSFVLVPNVQLYGGFDPLAGIETLEDERILPDMNSPEQGSILSGDFNGNDNTDNYDNHTENAHHVTIVSGNVGSALMDGFTVTGGYATGNTSGSSVMGRTVYRFFGGGTYLVSSSPQLMRMVWFNNLGEWGGGLYNTTSLSTEIGSPELSNVTFYRNMAPGGGGGIRNFAGSVDINQAIFAHNGAGLVEDGTSSGPGGGIYTSGNGTSLSVTNATFYGNWIVGVFIPHFDGGAIQVEQTSTTLNNVVIWGNEVEGDPADPSASISISLGGDVTVANSLVAHSGGSANWNNATGILDGGNNIDADPVFVSTAPGETGYLQPSACSPAISTGSNTAYTDAGGNLADDLDLAGNPRVYNQAGGGVIDMGAYEYQGERVSIEHLTALAAITVNYGTALGDITGLPTTVTAGLNDDTDVSIPLDGNLDNWTLLTPAGGAYNGDVAGIYVFAVPLLIPAEACYLNPEDLQAEVTVEVAKGTPVLTISWDGTTVDVAEGLSLTYGDTGVLAFGTTDPEGEVTYALGDADPTVIDLASLSAVAARQAGTATLTVSQVETDNFEAASVALAVTVGQKPVTIVPAAGQGKVYGTDDPEEYDFELADGNALAFDDGLTDIVSAASREVGENVGTYDIEPEFNGTLAGNYAIAFNEANGAFVITPMGITVAAENQTKIYGADDPELTYAFTPALVGSDEFAGGLARDPGENAGNYTITQGSLSLSGNYTITFEAATLTITPADYEGISFNDLSATYNGAEHTLSLTGDLPEGASVSYEIEGEPGNGAIQAGTYEVTALIDGGNNYEDTELTATLTITPLAVTVTATDKTKVFGADDPALTYTFTPALIDGAAFVGSLDRELGEDVGDYAILQGDLSIDDNYAIIFEPGTLTIMPAGFEGVEFTDLTVTYDGAVHTLGLTGDLPEGATATYTIDGEKGNGATDAGAYRVIAFIDGGNNYDDMELTALLTIEKAVLSGLHFEDTVYIYQGAEREILITGDLPVGADVIYTNQSHTDVGEYMVTATVSGNNYEPLELQAKLVILPLQLNVTADNKQKVYGTADPVLTYTAVPALIGDDAFAGGLTREKGEAVGEYPITQGSLSAGDNYEITFEVGTLAIIPGGYEGVVFDDASFTYDGTTKSLKIEGTLPEGVTVSYENNGRTAVGSQQVAALIDGGDNYDDLELTATLTITPAERTLDFPALAAKTYGDGDFDAGATASSGEAIVYTSSNPVVAEVTEGGLIRITGAGEATITATVAENGNYGNRPSVSRVLTVGKAAQAITFNAPAEVNRDAGAIQLDVTASSGLPVTLSVDDEQVATLDGSTLSIHRLGTVRITAVQAGDANHEPADPVTVTVRVIDPSASLPVRVAMVISPNGDGINEFLMVEGIGDYPENRLTIVNRNGTLIWEAGGYDNSRVAFRGRLTGGHNAPAGTYFYILEVKVDGRWKHEKGYFVLRY
ncbi:BspA family leucine-rich repeat surface protein [Parapedobacter lycopersici]|uniref:BspA family leucine-rich repeat surface protein n=1 Tax=Parapedobacter lycopersici TaxID=1864939 RepID=UPI00214D6BFF|nr:BspA family leucine-rich repeat surface protein [Parapedobacter lycopersici]